MPPDLGAGFDLLDSGLVTLDPLTLVRIMRLRCDVFVVEQTCPYPEIDAYDEADSTRHVWLAPTEQPTQVASYLRVIDPGIPTQRLGRIVTGAGWRGQGLGRALVQQVLEAYPGPTVLDAQSHLRAFYEGLGFAVDGPEFVEDGIPHLPMQRTG